MILANIINYNPAILTHVLGAFLVFKIYNVIRRNVKTSLRNLEMKFDRLIQRTYTQTYVQTMEEITMEKASQCRTFRIKQNQRQVNLNIPRRLP